MPTVCSETCTGRMRYLDYMTQMCSEAASAKDEKDLYENN